MRVPSAEQRTQMLDFERPHDLAEVGVYADSNAGFDHGLVVLAMGEAFWLEPVGDHYRLLVEAKALERVKEQLACFDRESTHWPPPRLPEEPGKRIGAVYPAAVVRSGARIILGAGSVAQLDGDRPAGCIRGFSAW